MTENLTREQLLAKDDKAIVHRAQVRFDRTLNYEEDAMNQWRDDYLFAHGDDKNNYQWPSTILQNRDVDDRPALTINQTRQHNLQVINEAKRTRPAVTYKPVGGKASKKSSEILEGLVRHIEYKSKAAAVYGAAISFQVTAGIGYWRVITEFVDDESFAQEPRIELIDDPLGVLLDPDTLSPDKSDAEYGFVFRNLSRDDFLLKYPGHHDALTVGPFDMENDWINENHVRVAEYYEREKFEDHLCVTKDGNSFWKSRVPKALWDTCVAMTGSRTRKLWRHKVWWYLIAGRSVLEKKELPNQTIPVVQLPAEVTVIDGRIDRRGMTRYLRSPQQMYNFWTSAAAEQVALQTKTPWLITAEAMEGHEDQWSVANTENFAVLVYNKLDESGQPNPPPERQNPPVMAQAYIQGMQIARMEMMMASGQYQAEMGQQTPERSALALQERKAQSDNATYQFVEQLGLAIERTGAILLELFPVLYDTERVIMILGEDGEAQSIKIDPTMQEAFQELQGDAQAALNPAVGKYEVQARVGPSYATQREAAYDALLALATQAPDTFPIVADVLFSNADWPRAGELSDRFKRMVPPQALGGAPSQVFQQMQQKILELSQKLQAQASEKAGLRLQALIDRSGKQIEAYRADTERLKVLLPDVDQGQLKDMVKGLLTEILQESTGGEGGGDAAGSGTGLMVPPGLPPGPPPGAPSGPLPLPPPGAMPPAPPTLPTLPPNPGGQP